MNNKPYLYSWSVLLFGMLALGLTISFINSILTAMENDPSGMWMLGLPIVFIFLVQLGMIGLIGWLLIKAIGDWNTTAMVICSTIVPLTTSLIIIWISEKIGMPINEIGNPTPFLLIAGLYIINGVIVYNDIKYRKPKIYMQQIREKP